MKLENHSIILVDANIKNLVIKKISQKKSLTDIKVMSFSDIRQELYFNLDEQTIYYVMNKYNLKYDIAKIYIKNLYYIEDKQYNNDKLDKLVLLKKELDSLNLLQYNNLFKSYLESKKIVVYNLILNKEEEKILNYIKSITEVEYVNETSEEYVKDIFEFNTLEDEVIYVASCIVELIKSGVDINNIYITNIDSEYRLIIKRYFDMFNIPYNLKESETIYNTHIVHEFLRLYDSHIDTTINQLSEIIKTKEDSDIFNQIINICNKYVWCDNYLDIFELIKNDLKNTIKNSHKLENAVREIPLNSTIFDNTDYVFLLGFNQGIIPVIHKDEKYLKEKELTMLGLDTCNDLNKLENILTMNHIKKIKNLVITYKVRTLNKTLYISSINDYLNYNIVKGRQVLSNHSNLYNKLNLSMMLDNHIKYGISDPLLYVLKAHYQDIKYRTYDNSYKPISQTLLHSYMNNELKLSYSALDIYNRCSFRYYINNILRLNIYEETFMQTIGNIFHYILSVAFTETFNFETEFSECIKNQKIKFDKKEKFFLRKLKDELLFIINTIKDQDKLSNLNESLYEDKVVIEYNKRLTVTFTGYIDKIKYKKDGTRTIVAIIDYKTGNPYLNLNTTYYGIGMQLPVYLFLCKNNSKLENVEVAGFYLQKILNNEIVNDNKTSYIDQKKKNLLLQGYSNSDSSILKELDNTYEDSKMIKSMKVGSNGFYQYSKVLSNSDMDALTSIVEEKIDMGISNITNACFDINPKRIGMNNLGCENCKYNDICYRKEKDIVNLKEYKDLEFLRGEE